MTSVHYPPQMGAMATAQVPAAPAASIQGKSDIPTLFSWQLSRIISKWGFGNSTNPGAPNYRKDARAKQLDRCRVS